MINVSLMVVIKSGSKSADGKPRPEDVLRFSLRSMNIDIASVGCCKKRA